jgi:hypothetical protein
MVKRPPSSQSTCSSEYELKPDIESDDEKDDNVKSKAPTKKAKAMKSPLKPKKDTTPVCPPLHSVENVLTKKKREAPRPWTPAEDQIFIEIMSKCLKAGMWEAVKQDGRLGYRGGQGISAHLTSVVRLSCNLIALSFEYEMRGG